MADMSMDLSQLDQISTQELLFAQDNFSLLLDEEMVPQEGEMVLGLQKSERVYFIILFYFIM
jgi:hypothetical protein